MYTKHQCCLSPDWGHQYGKNLPAVHIAGSSLVFWQIQLHHTSAVYSENWRTKKGKLDIFSTKRMTIYLLGGCSAD